MDARTRFVYDYPHQRSELFSVIERRNGGLIVTLKSAKFFTADNVHDTTEDIASQKYSVHLSRGNAITTHHTLILKSGTEIDSAGYQSSADDIAWPLFARAGGLLGSPHYKSNIRPKDTVVSVAKPCTPDLTLLFCVFISGANVQFCSADFPEFGFLQQQFGAITVNVVFGWCLAPPVGLGTLIHCGTNTIRKNREFVGPDLRSLITTSMDKPTACSMICQIVFTVAQHQGRRVIEMLGLDGPVSPALSAATAQGHAILLGQRA